MAKKKELTPEELEQQADALLAAADAAEEAGKQAEPTKKSAKHGAAPSKEETPHIMTDEEAKKAGIVRLDDKQVAALPAAGWLISQEKLREITMRIYKDGYTVRNMPRSTYYGRMESVVLDFDGNLITLTV